jgi:hypothetical protein
MRKIIILLAITVFGMITEMNGQQLKTDKTDDFTGDIIKTTKDYVVGVGVGLLYARVSRVGSSEGLWVWSSSDLGCSGASNNFIMIKFTDGSTIKYKDSSSVDCSGGEESKSLFMFKIIDFKGKTIEKIRFRQSELYDDYTVETGEFTFLELIKAVQ